MATSLSTLSHRLSIRPKPFPFSIPNRPNSLSFPILPSPSFSLQIFPSPSLSLTKIHCTPPEAEDNETFSEEEEEEEVDPIFLDAEEAEDDEEEEEEEDEEGEMESEAFLDEEGNEVEWDVAKLVQFMKQEQGEGDSEPSETDILEFLKKKESDGEIDEEFLNQFLITNDSDESYEETETEGQQPSLSSEEADDGFTGPLFEDTEETEEEAAIDFELLYGPAFSGVSYLEGNDVDEMDSKLENVVDEYNNLVTTKPVDDFEERVLELRSVTKVVKGGKNMSFRAVVAIGDKQGHVGIGVGKALEVADAVVKAIINGRRNIVTVPLTKTGTFYHKAIGRYGAAEVMLKPAAPGSGVQAGATVRAILELAGVQNALGKQLGSDNAMNNSRATIVATQMMRSWSQVSQERGVSIEEMWK